MSSILRALKKLDEEALHPEDHTGEQKIKMKEMVNRRTGTPMLLKRLFFILPALLLLTTAVLIIMKSNRHHSIDKKPPADASQKPLRAGLTPLSQSPSTKKKEPPDQTTPPVITSKQSQPAAVSVFSEIEKSLRSTKEEKHVQPATGKRITEKTAAQKGVEEINNSGFILNGIIWSDNPAMRVALINDQYLREGESINGVSVIEIKQKAVTLQRGQEKWTISMKK